MFFIDVSTGMATLKTGGASAVVPQGTTKLILPHEMLTANGTAQSVSASPLSSGHSTTTTLLLANNHFYHHNASFHNSSSLFNTNSNSSSTNSSHDITSSSSHHYIRPNSATTTSTAVVSNPSSFTSGNIFTTLGNQNYVLVGSNSSNNVISSATNAIIATPFNAARPSSSTSTTPITTIPNNTTSIMNNKMHTTANSTANSTILPASSSIVNKQTVVEQVEIETETEDNTTDVTTTANQPEATALESTEPTEEDPEIDIVINNVVCSFSVRCHLNLRNIALNGHNVEFRRENGMVTMKLRKPYTTASIWSSGKITCTGATSEDNAKVAARRYARMLQKLGFRVRFNNFRVVNVLGTCSMPWAIKITHFSEKHRKDASYEPELHPGVTYKLKEPKATLKIFSTGSITVTAASVSFVQQAIEHIYPLVYEFRKKRTPDEEKTVKAHLQNPTVFDPNDLIEVDEDFEEGEPDCKTSLYPPKKRRRPAGKAANDPQEDIMQVSDVEPDLDDSDDDL